MALIRQLLLTLPSALLLGQCALSPQNQISSGSTSSPSAPVAETGEVSRPETKEEEVIAVDVESPLVILDALVQAYPDRLSDLGIRDGDWSVLVEGEVFYWAGGRMLPADALERMEDYSPYSFRPYSSGGPQVPDLSPEDIERLKSRIKVREAGLDGRNPDFLVAVWGMDGYLNAENTVVYQRFLGWKIRIHPGIATALSAVENEIMTEAENSPETALWLEQLGPVGGYVWRDIAGSANRSLHSFGLAIDVQPAQYRGKQAYWRWAADFYDEWWSIPIEDRYMPPLSVVTAFENHGFTWGGKWFLFDQIHFEYRPELFILGEMAGTWNSDTGDF